jgi:hypothetical protein
MERVWTIVLAALLAAAALVWPVPYIAARSGRPRFVVALVLAAALLAAYEAWSALAAPSMAYERFWAGYRMTGAVARAAALAHLAVCAVAAWGLWHMRRWARLLAMGYLAYLVGSFLFWGLRGAGDHEDPMAVMLWQLFVLPFLTFGFMYLQRGAKHFRP